MNLQYLQYVSLVTLTVQNAILALSMRYSRTRAGHMFISSTAVLNSELIKMCTCLILVFREHGGDVGKFVSELKKTVIEQPVDTLKVCIPSMVYVIQNNLLYVAASHLDAGTYQVTYQLKILTTAIFSVIILRKKLISTQWGAMFILLSGVILVELAQTHESTGVVSENGEQNRLLGVAAAVAACCCSGFAGVYFEKILKGSATISIWMRNVQLSVCSIPFALITCYVNDNENLSAKGYFYGYDLFVWYLVILQACGGLLVAIVVKYADNLLKGFATSVAIILSCAVSIILFNFHLTLQFSIGTILVIGSIFLYGYQPPVATKSGMIAKIPSEFHSTSFDLKLKACSISQVPDLNYSGHQGETGLNPDIIEKVLIVL